MKKSTILKSLCAAVLISFSLPSTAAIVYSSGIIQTLMTLPRGDNLENNWIVGYLTTTDGDNVFFWYEGGGDTVPVSLIQSFNAGSQINIQTDSDRTGFITAINY